MNITIVGAGALGNMLATKLSDNNNIELIVKPENLDLISKKEISFKEIKGEIVKKNIEIKTDIGETDLLIICVKSYDVKGILLNIKDKETPILCCQNGLHTLNYMLKKFDRNKLSYLVTGNGMSKVKPGISEHKGTGFTYVGELNGEKSQRIEYIANELTNNGMTCDVVENIIEYIWLKAIINSAINPIATIAGIRNGQLKNSEHYIKLEKICNESINIAKKKGIHLPLDPWSEINSIIEKTSENKCSMLQDIENKQETEICAINGELIKIAKKLSIDSTYNQQVFSDIENLSVYS